MSDPYTTCECGHPHRDHHGEWGGGECNYPLCGCMGYVPKKRYPTSKGCSPHVVGFYSKGKCVKCGKQVALERVSMSNKVNQNEVS